MEKGSHLSIYHIFQHGIKKNKINFPHRPDTKLMDMSNRYRLRDDNSPDMEKGMHWSIYHIFQHWIKKNKTNFPHRQINKCYTTR